MASIKKLLIALVSIGMLMSLALAGDLVFAVGETTTVPSGVPTEAPGEPVRLEVPEGTLTLNGCASPSAFVTIFEDNTPIGTIVADNFGRFSKLIGNQEYGLHALQIFQEDKLNNISTTAKFTTSLKAHSDNFMDVFLPPTVYHDKHPVVLGENITFRGFTCPNSVVNLNINNNLTLIAKANDFGNWWIVANTLQYALGTHTYSVQAQLGNDISAESEQYIFRTARRSPLDRDNFFPAELTTPQILTPDNRYTSGSKQVTLTGVGPANTQIEIYGNGRLVGSVFSNPLGEWSLVVNMTNTQTTFTARACNEGLCTAESPPTLIFYSGDTEGCRPLLELDNVRFWGLRKNDGLDLSMDLLSGEPSYEFTLDWGDATVEHITLYRDNNTAYHHVYKDIGQYNGSLEVTDARGCTEIHYFSVGVTKDLLKFPWLQAIVLAFLVSTIVGLVHYVHALHEERDFLASTLGRIRARSSGGSDDTDLD